MRIFLPHFLLSVMCCIAGSIKGFSQADTTNGGNYDAMSLQDLLTMKIVSVSKKTEFLFDAPLSASVITKEDIRKAGSNSIMEALRLVPGMIVREQSNGNYDIHLRGMDNVPPNAPFDGNSTTTLVMIDSRPIYNYLKGGTFWETLPVDINDVEKIEVIRGPAAALYGPNAVNGVINIITRQTKRDGLYLVANAQQGSYQTFINNASAGFQSKKWSMIVSGNYQGRDRSQTSYYEFFRNEWREQSPYSIGILNDTVLTPFKENPRLAMKKYAGNAFISFNPADEIKITLSAGAQHSMVQKVSTENGVTPLSQVASDSRYTDIRASIKGLSAQFAYIEGTQNPIYPNNKYDFNTIDANIEYNYTKGGLSIKPGLSYRSAVYDDTKYSDTLNQTGVFNARGEIITMTASLRGEYKMLRDKLRLVAGVAANKFNFPDKVYTSYQLAATYKLNKKHLVRAVYSQAPRSATIYDTYINQRAFYTQIGYQKYMTLNVEGNKNLQLLLANMLEIGYRGTIATGFYVDIELFDIRSKNYSSLAFNPTYVKLSGNDTILVTPLIPTNLPVTLHQQGITISLNYQASKFHVKPFITLQRSRVKNYAPFLNTADATWPLLENPALNNINSGMGNEMGVKSTPAVFGGASFNWLPGAKFNINLSTYYYTAQTYTHASNIVFHDGVRGIDNIHAKVIVNGKVSFEPRKGITLFCTGKNLMNDRSREFFRSDTTPFMLLGGLNIEF
ncbi:MAG: TonB-dependent receptor plug domain-containing protein [Ferruginibacter sp.]|nr:TonB-dependent receptor plug domain-containing protein [Chitinophagaceae bacterium]